jgi:hypothetical protein
MADTTSMRVLLQAGGYSPIPVIGKVPAQQAWQKHIETNPTEIALWRKLYPDAVNTGILTRLNPTIDADLLDEEAAEAVEGLFREYFEERGHFLVRMGRAPKRAFLLRTDVPFPKIVRNVTAPDGKPEKIEVLCDGQQVVVFGIHPDTRRPYLWHGGEPGAIRCEDLPYVRADELVTLLDRAVELLVRDHGYTAAAVRPRSPEGRTNGAAHSPDDWGYLIMNVLAGHELHDTTASLTSKLAKAGMGGGAIYNMMVALYDRSAAADPAAHAGRYAERLTDLNRMVDSAVRKYAPGAPVPQPPGAPPRRVFALDREPEGGAVATAFTVVNMLPEVGVAILSGHPGVGKTHIVNDLMCSVATGMPFAGYEVARVCGAALFAAEGASTAHERWKVLRHARTGPWFESQGLPADTAFPVDYTDQVPCLNDLDAFEQYDATLTDMAQGQAGRMAAANLDYNGIGLVVIDTWNAATTLTDDQHNRVGSTQAIFNMLRRLATRHRCCVLVVDHLGKDQSRGPLGSINKTASPDVDLRITGKVEEDGSVHHTAMTIHKLRAGPQGQRLPFELKTVTLPHPPLTAVQQGKIVRWDASADGMHVKRQNKRHPALMRALDEALIEKWQWVRVGDNANFKAADSQLVWVKFKLSHAATADEGEVRERSVKKAFDRACRDSSEAGVTSSKELSDKRIVMWRTDCRFGDSSISIKLSQEEK